MSEVLTFRDAERAVSLLHAGGVVALPTDTVYGVGAWLGSPGAVAQLFTLKRRPEHVALPVMIGDTGQLASMEVDFNDRARHLAEAFWPGPLTIVVGASQALSELIGSPTATVGIRQPGDLSLLGLLGMSGPLAVTSANAHGEPPCHDVDSVLATFGGDSQLAGVIDGGVRNGIVSTVVDVSDDEWRVLRSGAIGEEALARVLH